MKKTKWLLMLCLVAAMGTAFATVKPSDPPEEFYLDENRGIMVPLTPNGSCEPGGEFCKYTLIPGHLDDRDPINYEGVPETAGQHWEL